MSQYLTPTAHRNEAIQRADGLPGSTNCTSGPLTVAYTPPDLEPFSAVSLLYTACHHPHRHHARQSSSDSQRQQVSGVSSFNYPATADSTLLTPVSSAGSPPLQQRPASTKPMRGYHSSQTAAQGAQVPTPPNTSRMYFNSFDGGSGSQSPSPLTVHTAATEAGHFDMTPYIAHASPNSSHHPSSPRGESDIPPPIDPYLGHFTVSGGSDSEVTHHPFPSQYTAYTTVEMDPATQFLVRHQAPHIPVSAPYTMAPNGAPASILAPPHPSQFRPQPMPRPGAIEDLRDPTVLLNAYQAQLPHIPISPSRRAPSRRKPSSTKRGSDRTPKDSPQTGAADAQSVNNGQGADDDGEELSLRDDAPEDDKYLFQLRKEFLSEKGKGMWEEMKARYTEKHQGHWEKAALQMKVSRAVAKYGVWPEKEIERLREAHRFYEEKRYNLILARMKENGGCKVWDWKPQHVEAMLVKLGIDEPTVDEKTGSRRRRNKMAHRIAHARGPQYHQHNATVMQDWSSGLGLHPAFQGHAQHVAAGSAARHMSNYDMMDDANGTGAPAYSQEQENEYLDQIFHKVKSEQEDAEGSSPTEMMDMGHNENNGRLSSPRPPTRDVNQHTSERVARQACEQMMQKQVHRLQQEHSF
ncbi:hypothetical protein QBC46DRAFT_379428 [Diplogelasinospora grovesii]|uniref:Uncharacterized protein n=1 Tax=Diplogelasinospora grovesii TaxID=303347 RepID=A0AAN6S6D1_9PEZI|nr:hypothetical protein QBC46DRAFT_379428 [Diplogelasinospora grovesii]